MIQKNLHKIIFVSLNEINIILSLKIICKDSNENEKVQNKIDYINSIYDKLNKSNNCLEKSPISKKNSNSNKDLLNYIMQKNVEETNDNKKIQMNKY